MLKRLKISGPLRWIATALVVLWALPLAWPSFPSTAGSEARVSTFIVKALSPEQSHAALCRCVTCPAAGAGDAEALKRCCCYVADSPQEAAAFRSFCDLGAPAAVTGAPKGIPLSFVAVTPRLPAAEAVGTHPRPSNSPAASLTPAPLTRPPRLS